jgi:hypothetical protein
MQAYITPSMEPSNYFAHVDEVYIIYIKATTILS